MQDSGEEWSRCDRGAPGGGGTAASIISEPLLVAMVTDRLTEEVRQIYGCRERGNEEKRLHRTRLDEPGFLLNLT